MCQSPTSKKRRGKKQKKTSTERRWNVSNLNEHFPPKRSRIEASPCGKVATLWLTRSSHNSHNTLTSPKLTLHPTKSFWIQRGVMLARQANKTAHMPLVRFPNPLANGSWRTWLTCHLLKHHLKLAYHSTKYKVSSFSQLINISALVSAVDWCSELPAWQKLKRVKVLGLKVSCSSPPSRLQLTISAPQSTRNHFREKWNWTRLNKNQQMVGLKALKTVPVHFRFGGW